MGPKDIRSTTWNLNRVRFRTSDHFPVITMVEGREFKTERRVKGWTGWTPVSEAEKAKFQELVLCPRSDHGEAVPGETEEEDGLVFLNDRCCCRDSCSRNRNTFCVPQEIRQMASDAAKSRDPREKKTPT